MLFSVKNTDKRKPFRQHDIRHKIITVAPGKGVSIELDVASAAFIRKIGMRGAPVEIKGADEEAEAALSNFPIKTKKFSMIEPSTQQALDEALSLSVAPQGNDKPKEEENPNGDKVGEKSEALLARIDEIPFTQFRSEAKELLGDKWPGGMLGKEEIIGLLKEHKP